MEPRVIYLDYNASTPVDPRVTEAMQPFFEKVWANPSSRSHRPGREAFNALEEARRTVAGALGARSASEIVFTSGATEANNLALVGAAKGLATRGRHLVTQATEHPSVLAVMRALRDEGRELTEIGVDREGKVRLDALESALRDDTVLVSLMLANNETGIVQPVREAASIVHRRGALLHCDAAQGVGKIPVDVTDLEVDLLSLSGHKLYAPKGVGALYVKDGTRIEPMELGGGQERGLRSGSENTPGIVGFGAAAEMAKREMLSEGHRLTTLRDRLIKGMLANVQDVFLNGHPTRRLPHNANFRYRYVEGEAMLLNLDMMGISVSSSSPCTSKSLLPSHVLLACDIPTEEAQSAVQFTLGKSNNEEEVDYVLGIMPDVVRKLRAMSPFSPENLEEMRSTAGHRDRHDHHPGH